MITVSTEVANALSQTSRQFDAKIYVNGSAVDCEIMSLKLHKGACGKFTVGSIFIPYVELTVNGTTTLTTNTEFELKIAVKVNGSFGTYYRVGYFKPTSIENGRTQTEIYAQGRIANTNGVLFSTEPTSRSLNNILTAIRNKGFTVDLKGLTIPSASIDQLIPLIGLSVRDGLSLLASCSGGYVTEDANGHIVLGKFAQSTPVVVNPDALSTYPTVKGEYELTGIKVVVNEALSYDIGGTANFQIENPYFNSDMVSTFTSNTIGYTFNVTEMPVALGDFRFEPWDCVAFTEGGQYPSNELYPSNTLYPQETSSTVIVSCLTLDFDFDGGLQTTIKADGDLPEVTNTKTAGPISAQLKEAYDKAVGANDLANSVSERVDAIEEDGVTTVITKVQWTYGDTNEPKGTWTDDIPALTSTYPYLWTRIATVSRDPQTGIETVTDFTTPQKSTLLNGVYTFVNHASNGDATVIDGGSIIAGTIRANQVVVGSATYLDDELGSMNDDISDAQSTASSASTTASSALTTADAANTTANNAQAAATDAAKTATNYITTISGGGVKVHAANDTSNYSKIDSSGLSVYVNGSKTSSFGSSEISLGDNSTSATIYMCGKAGSFSYYAPQSKFTIKTDSGLRVLADPNLYSVYQLYDSGLTVSFGTGYYASTLTFNDSSGLTVSNGITSNGDITTAGRLYGVGSRNLINNSVSSGQCRVGNSSDNLYLFGLTQATSAVGSALRTSNNQIYYYSSTRKIKHDIEPLAFIDSSKIYEIPVSQYVFNGGEETMCGLIAEDVNEVLPSFVGKDENGDCTMWDDIQMVSLLIKAVQDQHAEIELLKERLDNGL